MTKKVYLCVAAMVLSMGLTACQSQGTKGTEQTAGSGKQETQAEKAEEFKLSGNVDFLVSSKAGGGSDIFTRTITDIASANKLVDVPFIVNNLQDGNGQISRRQVSTAKNVDSTLLCFSAGDLAAMLSNGGLTMEDFTPVAILAADKHLAFVNTKNEYKSFEEIVEAAKSGTKIAVGGTASDEKAVFELLAEELGLKDQFSYIVYGSSSETITALLGGHINIGIAKPAASKEYVEAGDIAPVVAFSTERFAAPFEEAPTMEELGYNNVEYPVWRGVIGPKNMTAKGLEYWSGVLKKVSETEEWKTNYLDKNLLVSQFEDPETTKQTMLDTEATTLESMK
ncbi:tripartite tricarboxylate transporter substrate binding protein [Clostridium sp. AM58-1XD]|uniref:tripartite tricarboxylate transporter substrate binding protein n=1 Tax=Clostridium sp. AM58-1XD TaxID=2292307 RepID=UPI000E47D615|nr:tripartite tricarboxylate transporter substrate binding protein [Clostridium sp. AM58-1XD]RGZ00943.1 tripartite tricarboxylate transporter substrate binding protein [Clostridium sp. AM58-1XD]